MTDIRSGSPAHFIASFNADLDALGCAARVALAPDGAWPDSARIALHDDEGNFLDLIPASADAEMVVVAYRLYGRAFNLGVRAGEETAFAKLRFLIGAAAS